MDADEAGRPARGTVQHHAGSRPRTAAGPGRGAAAAGAARLSLGRGVLERRRRTGAARPRARRHPADRGSVRAQRRPRLSSDWHSLPPPRWRWPSSSRAKRSAWRGLRPSRNCICARSGGSAERRPHGKPRHRAGADKARAPEPASGAAARRAAGPCRRHHRRRRHDPARRARTDDAARPGGAPAGRRRPRSASRSSPRSARARWSTCCSCSWPRCG